MRLNMDQSPDNSEQNAQFEAYLLGLNSNTTFRGAGIRFRADHRRGAVARSRPAATAAGVGLSRRVHATHSAARCALVGATTAGTRTSRGACGGKRRPVARGSANLVPDRPPPPRCEQTWAMLIKRVYEVDPLACPGVRRK